MATKVRKRLDVGEAALKGALAGLVGALAITAVTKAETKALLPEGEDPKPPPQKFVETVAEEQGVELSEAQSKAAGTAVHLGHSALWGALYGVVQSRIHAPTTLHGLLLGGLVYNAQFPAWGLLPKMGVLPPPSMQSIEKASVAVGAHIAFGLATAAAFDALS